MSEIQRIPLSAITVSHNPRHPVKNLQVNLPEEGLEDWSTMDLVHCLALSAEANEQAEYIRLVEKYETTPIPEFNEHPLVGLADSRRECELQPVVLRSFRVRNNVTGEYDVRFGVIAGERRFMAAAYNYAKHGDPATIGAVVKRCTVDKGKELAIIENLQRERMTPVEEGWIYRQKRELINPATGKRFTLRQVAIHLKKDYQEVRSREALTYLSDAEQRAVEEGRLGLTKARDKGLQVKSGKDAGEIQSKKTNRRRVLTLRQVEVLFDETPRRRKEYLRAMADVMGITEDQALEESDARLVALDVRDAA